MKKNCSDLVQKISVPGRSGEWGWRGIMAGKENHWEIIKLSSFLKAETWLGIHWKSTN